MTPHPFTMIYKDGHDRAITAGGTASLAVYVALCRIHSDAKPEEKNSFKAGAGRIKRHCGLSIRHVKTQLRVLEAEGLISIKSGLRADRHGDHEENQVSLLGSAMVALGSAKKERENCTRIKKEPPKGGSNKKSTPLRSAAPASRAAGGGEEKKSRANILHFS